MRFCLVAFLVSSLAGTPAFAEPSLPDREAIQAAVTEAKARLKLTPEQEAQFRPIFTERTTKLKAIHAKHAGDTSRSAKRAMYKEARPVMEEYQQKVRAILTDEQEAEWEKMRDEAKARLKERYRSGKAPE